MYHISLFHNKQRNTFNLLNLYKKLSNKIAKKGEIFILGFSLKT